MPIVEELSHSANTGEVDAVFFPVATCQTVDCAEGGYERCCCPPPCDRLTES